MLWIKHSCPYALASMLLYISTLHYGGVPEVSLVSFLEFLWSTKAATEKTREIGNVRTKSEMEKLTAYATPRIHKSQQKSCPAREFPKLWVLECGPQSCLQVSGREAVKTDRWVCFLQSPPEPCCPFCSCMLSTVKGSRSTCVLLLENFPRPKHGLITHLLKACYSKHHSGHRGWGWKGWKTSAFRSVCFTGEDKTGNNRDMIIVSVLSTDQDKCNKRNKQGHRTVSKDKASLLMQTLLGLLWALL